MLKYHKIHTVFKREELPNGKMSRYVIEGKWTKPEFEFLKDNQWNWYEKIDGTNIRVMWDGNEITFGGRTDKAVIPKHLLKYLEETFLPLKDRFIKFFGNDHETILFGEGYGKKIQAVGPKYRPDDVSFIGFDVNVNGIWLKKEVSEQVFKDLGIDVVPLIITCSIQEAIKLVKVGFNSRVAKETLMAEGLVGVPAVQLNTRTNERIITKLKTRDFEKEENN